MPDGEESTFYVRIVRKTHELSVSTQIESLTVHSDGVVTEGLNDENLRERKMERGTREPLYSQLYPIIIEDICVDESSL